MYIPFLSNYIKRKENQAVAAYAKKVENRKKEDDEHRKESWCNYLNTRVGEPVIIIPPSNQSPTVGIIIRWYQAEPSIPVVKDYVTGEEYICFSEYKSYSDYTLRGLFKLTPEQRVSICYTHLSVPENDQDAVKRSLKDTVSAAKSNGFFAKVDEYENK